MSGGAPQKLHIASQEHDDQKKNICTRASFVIQYFAEPSSQEAHDVAEQNDAYQGLKTSSHVVVAARTALLQNTYWYCRWRSQMLGTGELHSGSVRIRLDRGNTWLSPKKFEHFHENLPSLGEALSSQS